MIEANRSTAYYLNLLSYREWAAKGMTPNTPAISLIKGLSAVCDLVEMEAGLQDFSYQFEPGAGVKAAQDVFLSSLRK